MPLFQNKKEEKRQQNLAAAQAGVSGPTMAPAAPGMAAPGQVPVGLPGPAPSTAGPHKHDFMNKLDPSVDSKSNMQFVAPGVQSASPATGVQGQTAAQFPGQRTAVPLGSNNPYGAQGKPRFENPFDTHGGSTQGNTGYYTTSGLTGVAPTGAAAPRQVPEGTYGPHSSNPSNTLDPRASSDAGHKAAMAGAMPTTQAQQAQPTYPPGVGGPAPNTVGPHRHDWMNKLDPTVDSRPKDPNTMGRRAA